VRVFRGKSIGNTLSLIVVKGVISIPLCDLVVTVDLVVVGLVGDQDGLIAVC